ncbi:MAG: hypothetical protein HYY06_09120 [Deltaproteobacteria bacterium]|nr:hypothetical protein [Deltaproteobacteria bacterium]
MAISAVSTATVPQTTGGSAQTSEIGRDAFMKLLVAQMRNQDPLDPMEARDFVTQLSQLTGVQELVTIGERVQALEIATAGVANTQVATLTGKTVTAKADTIRLEENGPGQTAFQLDGRAKEVTVTIRDESGQVVRTLELGESFPGSHSIVWDGNDASGQRAAAGRYTVEVAAKDESGNAVGTSTKVTGIVTGVSYENGYPELIVGEARVLLGDVVSISM